MNKIAATLQKFLKWRGFIWLMGGIIILALLLRASFLFTEYPALDNDPASYFYNAKSLAETSTLDESSWWGRDYVSLYPYTYNYMWLLSKAMQLVGANVGAVLLLNTLFSILAAVLLYFLFSKGLKNHRLGLLAAVIWFASPIEIAYGVLPFPLLAVNTCLIAALFITYLLLQHLNHRRFWVYTLLLGLSLGIANIFRPMMVVLIIALALVFAYQLVRRFRWNLFLQATFALAIIFAVMTGIQRLALIPPERITGRQDLDYYSGWSLFLGSNKITAGRWNDADNAVRGQLFDELGHDDLSAYDQRLRGLAIERYLSFAPVEFLPHFLHKSSVLLDGPSTSINYELRDFSVFIQNFYSISAQLFYPFFTLALFFFGVYRFIRTRLLPPFILATILTLLGLFASNILLTEVMDRYLMPLLPPLLIIGLWGAFLPLVAKKRQQTSSPRS